MNKKFLHGKLFTISILFGYKILGNLDIIRDFSFHLTGVHLCRQTHHLNKKKYFFLTNKNNKKSGNLFNVFLFLMVKSVCSSVDFLINIFIKFSL